MGWEFLSYSLNSELSGYGNGTTIEVNQVRNMCCGDTSNNTEVKMPTHFGTHLDFPFHFSSEGRKGESYQSKDFVFENVETLFLDIWSREKKLISVEDLSHLKKCKKTEALIIHTGFCEHRQSEDYWNKNPGFLPETSDFLKECLPSLKLIGFDSISLTHFQDRPLGRVAHKEFLIKNDLLILEDMDLKILKQKKDIEQMIVSPLRFDGADGAPVTVFARFK